MLSEQEKSEIRASYKNAIDPRQHVKILMQLYLVSHEEILDVLGPLSKSARPKPNRKGQPRRIYAPEFKAEAMQRLRSGESFRRVAEDMGVNVRTMATWAYHVRREKKRLMPNCKFCGKPVISARVMHAHCWEMKVMELMETVCDSYCRWPLECKSSEELEEKHCDACALIQALNLGL